MIINAAVNTSDCAGLAMDFLKAKYFVSTEAPKEKIDRRVQILNEGRGYRRYREIIKTSLRMRIPHRPEGHITSLKTAVVVALNGLFKSVS